MSLLSTLKDEKARKAAQKILQKMQVPGCQTALAKALGVSEATVSRAKNQCLENGIALIYSAKHKIVHEDAVCIDRHALDFMRAITVLVLSSEELWATIREDLE